MKEPVLILEALLFAAKQPLTPSEIAERMPEGSDLSVLLPELQSFYAERSFELVERAGRWSFQTRSDFAPFLAHEKTEQKDLSRAALEVLAVIAYHQPITRPEIEEIRGVSTSKGSLDMLMEQGWVKPGPRREEPGRPSTWLTTPAFCDAFGLTSLKDLPGLEELREGGFLAANDILPTKPILPQGELFEDSTETILSEQEEDENVFDETMEESA